LLSTGGLDIDLEKLEGMFAARGRYRDRATVPIVGFRKAA
jgi:hypothetical protein